MTCQAARTVRNLTINNVSEGDDVVIVVVEEEGLVEVGLVASGVDEGHVVTSISIFWKGVGRCQKTRKGVTTKNKLK